MNSGDGYNPETDADTLDSCADRDNLNINKKNIGWFWKIITKGLLKFGGYSTVEKLNLKGIDKHFHENPDDESYNMAKYRRLTGDINDKDVPVAFHYFGTKAPLLSEFNGEEYDVPTNVVDSDGRKK